LRSITAGAFVAGLAATAGFGLLAAATFSGKSTAQAATTGNQPEATPDLTGSGTTDDQGNDNAVTPGAGGLRVTPTPRPAPTQRSHASTGGSG
jgi:hypothetical protein